MIASGAPIKAVRRQLGHSSAVMSLDLYGHLYEDDLDALGAALDQRYQAAAATACLLHCSPTSATARRRSDARRRSWRA